ncbi:MAG: ABC transporter permease [Hyphomonadaceae bacterium]
MIEAAKDLGRTLTRWQTWILMGNQDINLRYRRSVFGPFWISFSLAALVLALSLLYSQVFEQPQEEYLRWLVSGFLVWFLLLALISEGCTVAIDAESQLRNVSIPIPVLVARMVYRNWIVFLHNALVFVGLAAIYKFPVTEATLWVIPGVAMVLAIGFFAAVILAPLCLRFRDITQVIINFMQIVFFLTPILWHPDQGRVSSIWIDANPIYHVLELVRAPLMGQAPTAQNWLYAEISLGVLIVLAWIVLSTSRKRIFLWL